MGLIEDLGDVDLVLNRIVEEALRLVLEHGPTVKQYSMDIAMDLIFVPRIVAKQMLLALILESGRFAIFQTYYKFVQGFLVQLFSSRARMLHQLQRTQRHAQSQDEFMLLAEQIDALTGDQEWRLESECPLYEKDRITTTIDHYLHLMRRREVFDLLYLLRGNLGRNQFGLLHKGLFSRAQAGTKVLVETYHNVVCAALEFVCDADNNHYNGHDEEDIPTEARLAFFNEVRHAYGRSSLLLSGGAALGYYHVGVVKALMENNLMPRVIGGSSAGSIVCAMIGTRTDEEIMNDLFHLKGTYAPGHYGSIHLEFFRPLPQQHEHHQHPGHQQSSRSASGLRNVYQNTAGAFHDSKRTWQFLLFPTALRQFGSTLYDLLTGNRRPMDLLKNDTEHFKNVVKTNCGNFTFQEAFDRTGRICNIIVSPKNQSDPPRLLNYLTAPHVLVWSAAVASASVPGIFEADCLLVKDPDGTERYESSHMTADGIKRNSGVQFSDGSFEQDLPMQQLSEMFNVNHFIISQVNPQAVLFGSYNHRTSVWSNPFKGAIDSLLRFLKHQCRSWLLNLMKFLGSRKFRPLYAQTRANIGTQLLTQEYEGRECDISLIPWINHRSLSSAFLHMLYNPTPKDFFEWMAAAERETWKYIPRIKCHIAEEIALDQCVQRLRNRLILEARTKRRGLGQTNTMIGNGLPSFFVSPSLTKLDNSGSAENQASISNLPAAEVAAEAAVQKSAQQYEKGESQDMGRLYQMPLKDNDVAATSNVRGSQVESGNVMHSGRAGLGLRGNRSSGSLDRQFSHSSGFFIDEEENPQQPPVVSGVPVADELVSQEGGSNAKRSLGSTNRRRSRSGSMANFYYRRASDNSLAVGDPGLFLEEQEQQQPTLSAVGGLHKSESMSSQQGLFD